MDDFENLSEEQIQQLIELGIIDDNQDILGKQLAQANSIRNAPGPEMRGNGRVMTAANPMEHIAHAMQGIKAGNEAEALQAQQQEMLKKQVAGRQAFYNLRRPPQQPGLGPMPEEDLGVY